MSTDPYAAPTADLGANDMTIPTSIWSANGRLGVLACLAQNFLVLVIATIIAVAIIFGVGLIFGGGDMESMMSGGGEGPAGIIMMVTLIPLYLAIMWITICLAIKRLHDRNHSGWWILIMFIPLINLIFTLYVYFVPGNKDSNRFGAPRPTKGWEKVLGIIGLILFLGSILLTIGMFGAAFLGMGDGGLEALMQGG